MGADVWAEYDTPADLDAWLAYLDATAADPEPPPDDSGDELDSAPTQPEPARGDTMPCTAAPSRLVELPKDPWRSAVSEIVFNDPFPHISFLCEQLDIGPGRPMGLWGLPGSGKNITVQAIALAIATGRAALRRYPCRAAGARVLHVTYDLGLVATALRYRQLANSMGLSHADIADRFTVCAHPGVTLTSPKALKLWAERASGFDLVILDNARGGIPGVDENASDFGRYLSIFGAACAEVGATPLYLHHVKKEGNEGSAPMSIHSGRGTGAIVAASGAVWGLDGQGGGPRTLVHLRAHDTATELRQSASVKMTLTAPKRSDRFDTGGRPSIALEAIPIETSDDPGEATVLRQLSKRDLTFDELKSYCSALHTKGKLEPTLVGLVKAGRVYKLGDGYRLARQA